MSKQETTDYRAYRSTFTKRHSRSCKSCLWKKNIFDEWASDDGRGAEIHSEKGQYTL